ncbi:hypothetical protein [Kitasatospora sp. LaBMicrA B282]|uniref:hypothetical protein n=1 Tax=Kitasatospora sp. LaBMicrA B282 TaxID=3420949 RepID=UPI003D0EBED1
MTEQQEIEQTDLTGFAHELVACVLLRAGEDEPDFPNAPHRAAAYVVSIAAVVIILGLLLVLLPPF